MSDSVEKNRRIVIAELFHAGRKASEIIRDTGYAPRTVYRIVSNLRDGKGILRKAHSPRNDKIRTKRFLCGLKRSIAANPSQSMASLAKKRNVTKMTISKAVRKDLGMKSFCRRRRNILTAKSRAIRNERSLLLLNHLKHRGGDVRIFVDEKKFVVDEVSNRRNSRCIAKDSSCVPPVMESKFPASVMVFGAVASDGKVMPPHFIEAGLKINTVEYLKILEEVLLPWIKKNYDPMKVMFVQDSAPAHGSKTVQTFLKREIPLFVPSNVWPSSSPDLNPCDYWLWGDVEKVSNSQPHNTVASLKTSIKRAFRIIKEESVIKACRAFRGRIQQVVDAEGGYIE